jgi:6,7-dimethyl-8-ribityllumazine synthase
VKIGRKARQTTATGAGYRFAVVVSRFNVTITKRLLDGAVECLKKHGVRDEDVKVFPCPGAFELPQVASALCSQGGWDAIICLGAVIRGETPHFEYVSSEAARGIQEVALRHSAPVTFGVLTTNSRRQAMDRSGGKHGNKGWDAALAAVEMVEVFDRVIKRRKSIRTR